MLLALNAGSVEIRIGCLERGYVISALSLETRATRTADEYAVLIERSLSLRGIDPARFDGAVCARRWRRSQAAGCSLWVRGLKRA